MKKTALAIALTAIATTAQPASQQSRDQQTAKQSHDPVPAKMDRKGEIEQLTAERMMAQARRDALLKRAPPQSNQAPQQTSSDEDYDLTTLKTTAPAVSPHPSHNSRDNK